MSPGAIEQFTRGEVDTQIATARKFPRSVRRFIDAATEMATLDEDTAAGILALLREIHAEGGLTSVIVTHNPAVAAGCDRILKLQNGLLRPVADAPAPL